MREVKPIYNKYKNEIKNIWLILIYTGVLSTVISKEYLLAGILILLLISNTLIGIKTELNFTRLTQYLLLEELRKNDKTDL